MLYEIMKHIRNFFPDESFTGHFAVTDGKLTLYFVEDGRYILIEGSKFNDGVYKYPAEDLTDEVFDGTVTALDLPKDFLSLCEEIKTWKESNKATALVSESFGGYSYTKAVGPGGQPAGWPEVFRSRLNAWRKL